MPKVKIIKKRPIHQKPLNLKEDLKTTCRTFLQVTCKFGPKNPKKLSVCFYFSQHWYYSQRPWGRGSLDSSYFFRQLLHKIYLLPWIRHRCLVFQDWQSCTVALKPAQASLAIKKITIKLKLIEANWSSFLKLWIASGVKSIFNWFKMCIPTLKSWQCNSQ